VVTKYFSVDRRGFYRAGGRLDLFRENPLKHSFLSVQKHITPTNLANHLRKLFPNGLSLHGWDHMTRHQDWTDYSTSNSYANYDITLELLLEYVRRSMFPQRPSRMQCYFAFDSLEGAKGFRAGEQSIFRLRSEKVLRLDQGWLTYGDQSVVASYCAHNYWSGTATTEPKWEYVLVPPVEVLERVA
jgi:Protein of unknown function (DUF2441)